MSIFGLLFRFACVYIAILVAISVAFARIGVSHNSAINTGALIGAVFLGCGWFITMNKRTLIDREKRIAFLGMWAIDLALQGIAVVGVCALSGFKITFGPLLLVCQGSALLSRAGVTVIEQFDLRCARFGWLSVPGNAGASSSGRTLLS